jgi:hypothetical protein
MPKYFNRKWAQMAENMNTRIFRNSLDPKKIAIAAKTSNFSEVFINYKA